MSDTNVSGDSSSIHFKSQVVSADSGCGVVYGGVICSANTSPSN